MRYFARTKKRIKKMENKKVKKKDTAPRKNKILLIFVAADVIATSVSSGSSGGNMDNSWDI